MRPVSKTATIWFTAFLMFVCCGCGRYLPPLPPEITSPTFVEFVGVETDADGVTITWLAPEESVRGKKLKKLDGYRIYRRVLPERRLKESEAKSEYELAAVVWDNTVELRREREDSLRKEYKPVRQAKLSTEERSVAFIDHDVEQGVQYLYKVVAFNKIGFDGPARQFIEVLFDGDKSVTRKINSEEDAGLLGDGEISEGDSDEFDALLAEEEEKTSGKLL